MFFRIFTVSLPLFFMSTLVTGQPAPDVPAQPSPPAAAAQSDTTSVAEPNKAEPPDISPKKSWRDTSGYPFPALADTLAAAQNMVQAMLLRDYCANEKIPDNFVLDRLARFSRITGREEDCQSLLDYVLR
jgi:hypothetical protein